ncbi:unnamed protein product, partial [Discosporangium mesarthrocarpum]
MAEMTKPGSNKSAHLSPGLSALANPFLPRSRPDEQRQERKSTLGPPCPARGVLQQDAIRTGRHMKKEKKDRSGPRVRRRLRKDTQENQGFAKGASAHRDGHGHRHMHGHDGVQPRWVKVPGRRRPETRPSAYPGEEGWLVHMIGEQASEENGRGEKTRGHTFCLREEALTLPDGGSSGRSSSQQQRWQVCVSPPHTPSAHLLPAMLLSPTLSLDIPRPSQSLAGSGGSGVTSGSDVVSGINGRHHRSYSDAPVTLLEAGRFLGGSGRFSEGSFSHHHWRDTSGGGRGFSLGLNDTLGNFSLEPKGWHPVVDQVGDGGVGIDGGGVREP